MTIQFKLISACCENMGIGKNGDLPWRLKLNDSTWYMAYSPNKIKGTESIEFLGPRNEMQHFTSMTTKTHDSNKKNVVVLGKKSWDCIPGKYKPLVGRINFVLTSAKNLDVSKYRDTYVFNSWDQIVDKLEDPEFRNKYEDVWICGGSKIYEDAMKSKHFYRLYLTRIKENYDCDTFFPKLIENIKKVSDTLVPQGIQEENGIQWEVEVWEKQ